MMKTFLILLIALALAVNLTAADLKGLSLIGIRLGIGHTSQATPDQLYSNFDISADQNGFYSEAFYNWHFLNEVALDVGLAALNRGEFRWQVPEGNFFGNINIYPIMVGLKIKPLVSALNDHYQPYLAGGGSILVGRSLIEGGSVSDPYAYISRSAESETRLGWWLGGGFDAFVSSTICLSSCLRYQSIKFHKPIGGFKDHSGYQISFGVAYIFRKK